MPHTLPALPYAYDALEPHIDAKTMEIHHTKHHQAYIDKVNAALQGTPWTETDIVDVLCSLDEMPEEKRTAIRNNGGGHFSHSLFWTVLSPAGGGAPSGDLAAAIDTTFGSFDAFKEKFAATALNQFGSGWAWLFVDKNSTVLQLKGYPNQDSPIMEGKTPILGLDVWEHAYYLKHQNKRADYIATFWKVVDWAEVERRFAAAIA